MADDFGPYYLALSAIGAYCDRDEASEVTIVEVTSGFELRCSIGGELIHRSFSRGTLEVNAEGHWRDSGEPNYFTLLAVTGMELDRLGARNILIDEQERELAITYQLDDHSTGYLLKKQLLMLDRNARHEMLDKAREPTRRRTIRGRLLNRS
ncbi:MAG: hypothetical protein ACRDFS_07880 [Chloroflexota bacterium]